MKTILIFMANIIFTQDLNRQISSVRGFLVFLLVVIIFIFLIAYNSNNTPKNKR